MIVDCPHCGGCQLFPDWDPDAKRNVTTCLTCGWYEQPQNPTQKLTRSLESATKKVV